jgi:serine/threonine protein kinase
MVFFDYRSQTTNFPFDPDMTVRELLSRYADQHLPIEGCSLSCRSYVRFAQRPAGFPSHYASIHFAEIWSDPKWCRTLRECKIEIDDCFWVGHYGGTCKETCRSLIRPHECVEGAFAKSERIGFGSSGEVFKVMHNRTAKTLALKVIRCRDSTDRKKVIDKYERLRIDSDRVVPVLAQFPMGETDVGVLMPLYKGTLADGLRGGKRFTLTEIYSVAVNVLEGLVAMAANKPPLIHRDLKPSNIFLAPSHAPGVDYFLVGDMDTVKFCDGGMSAVTGGTGTFAHLAPEQICDFTSTPKTDMWGLGCVLHWLVVGGTTPKVMHTNAMRYGAGFAQALLAELRSANHDLPPELSLLIVEMLSVDSDCRPSAVDCLAKLNASAKERSVDCHTCTCGLPSARQLVTANPEISR